MVKVWDLFVRWSHWLIVLLVISAWLSSEFGDSEYTWHSLNGYAIFVLVLSRIIWGFVGSTTARFSYFIRSPIQSFKYLLRLFSTKEKDTTPESLGHNPAGGWMVVVLLIVLLAQATTGMFTSDDISFEGPFAYYVSSSMSGTLTSLHHLLFNGLLVLVGLHILAVLYHQLIKKEALIKAMLTGKKKISSQNKTEVALFKFPNVFLALFIIILISSVLWWLIQQYG